MEDIEAFGRIGRAAGGITRLAWSPELRTALDRLAERLEAAGLKAELDAAGNLLGRWLVDDGGRAVVIGSHLDTVPCGGAYDGALGVLAGLSVVEALRANAISPARPVWVAAFMDEEGSRFGTSMFGSRAFVDGVVETNGERVDSEGTTLRAAMAAYDRDFDKAHRAHMIERVDSFLELHIEQGPILEQRELDVGIVEGCFGASRFQVRLAGQANHAGTTPLERRRDALVGAARVILALREGAERDDLTVTVGEIGVDPGAFNVIPGVCQLSVDVRTPPRYDIRTAEELVRAVVGGVAANDGLEQSVEVLDGDPGIMFDPDLIETLERAAEELGATHTRMTSGAGHDAMVFAKHVPAGMIFVPSHDGISHSPQEHTTPRLCELGARVLGRAVELLAVDQEPVRGASTRTT